jgi:hypothetical protein
MNDHSHLRRDETGDQKSLLGKDAQHIHTETGKELLDRIKHIGHLISTVTPPFHFEF